MPQYGELIIISTPKGRRKLRRLIEGENIHSQEGVLLADELTKVPFGAEINTNLGIPIRILRKRHRSYLCKTWRW